ncbi:hypothetical protein [Xanthocytophaga agilis]|uniref:Uncharacterized protein n=1 Tax=Xanthocytophaga agilis TaxID=3048010 RepID=A0AAE3UEB9_9BACT|nr:hypothetical protein [Xanthocytophaga agilis]MDJ1501211.1 hypothetical protein [Xanthocytophaga agilis]
MWRSLNSITLLWLFSGYMDVKTTTDTKELVCDSLIYSLDNRISENAIDSLVRGKTVVIQKEKTQVNPSK